MVKRKSNNRERTGRGEYSSEFKKLLSHWNKRLAKEGFDDIEQHGQPSLVPDVFTTGMNVGKCRQTYDPFTAEYYYQATHWIPRVEPGRRRKAWRLHAQGMTLAEIGPLLGLTGAAIGYWIRDERKKMLNSLREGSCN